MLYLGANLVYLHLIPIEQMKQAELVAADVAQLLIGPAGIVAISAAVAVSTFGTLNGSMMTAPRIFFAMAEDGLFPEAIARVDPRDRRADRRDSPRRDAGCDLRADSHLHRAGRPVHHRDLAVLRARDGRGVRTAQAPSGHAATVPDAGAIPSSRCCSSRASLFLLGNYLVSETRAFAVDVAVILSGLPIYYGWKRWGTGT